MAFFSDLFTRLNEKINSKAQPTSTRTSLTENLLSSFAEKFNDPRRETKSQERRKALSQKLSNFKNYATDEFKAQQENKREFGEKILSTPLREWTPWTAEKSFTGTAPLPEFATQFRGSALEALTFGLAKNKQPEPTSTSGKVAKVAGQITGFIPAFAGAQSLIGGTASNLSRLSRTGRVATDLLAGTTALTAVSPGSIKERLSVFRKDLTSPYSIAISAIFPFAGSVKPITEGVESVIKKSVKEGVEESVEKQIKRVASINLDKLGLEGGARQKVEDVIEVLKPELEKITGKTLTNKEVLKASQKATVLDGVVTKEETKSLLAQITKTRQVLADSAQGEGITKEFIDSLMALAPQAKDAGRTLQAFNIGVEGKSIKETITKELLDLGHLADDIIKKAKGIDFNNQIEVNKFYREFVKPNLGNRLDELRYVSMLSSPKTHIVNAFSNFIQTGVVAPVEKTITGGLDWASSKLTGKERQYFVKDGVDYAKGYWKALPEAWEKTLEVMKGEKSYHLPDIDFIPPSSTGKSHIVLRALEAGDAFFRTLTTEGLEATGKTTKEAVSEADYRLFRKMFDPDNKTGQGVLLSYMDKFNSWVQRGRKIPGVKWIIPFLQTPTNIAKQMIEYSPAGVATMVKNKDPLVQLSKSIIGTSIFATFYGMAQSGLVTGAPPKSEKARNEFYNAGLKPWSVKIGNTWVSFNKIGPLAGPMAVAVTMAQAEKDGANDKQLAKLGEGLLGMVHFWADQSYIETLGQVFDAVGGDKYAMSRVVGNVPSQLIPYRALIGWFNRSFVDKTYRKPDGWVESIKTQLPILSKTVEPYTNAEGEESKRQFPGFNAFSPLQINQKDEKGKAIFDINETLRNQKRELNAIKDEIEKGVPLKKLQDDIKSEEGGEDSITMALREKELDADQTSLINAIFKAGGGREHIESQLEAMDLPGYELAQFVALKGLGIENGDRGEELKRLIDEAPNKTEFLKLAIKNKALTAGVIKEWEDSGEISEADAIKLRRLVKTRGESSVPATKKRTVSRPTPTRPGKITRPSSKKLSLPKTQQFSVGDVLSPIKTTL